MRLQVETRKVTGKERDARGQRIVKSVHYVVVAMIPEGMASDGMWSRIEHAARFASKEKAERLAAKIQAVSRGKYLDPFGGIDLAYWLWTPSVCCPFSALQAAPTAVPYDVN